MNQLEFTYRTTLSFTEILYMHRPAYIIGTMIHISVKTYTVK